MLEDYEYLIKAVLKNVPNHLRDDCYQSACVGLLRAFQRKEEVEHFKSYAYNCIKSEVINEIAKLNYPVSLDKTTFLLLCKYKKLMSKDGDASELNISPNRQKNLNRLCKLNRVPYEATE